MMIIKKSPLSNLAIQLALYQSCLKCRSRLGRLNLGNTMVSRVGEILLDEKFKKFATVDLFKLKLPSYHLSSLGCIDCAASRSII